MILLSCTKLLNIDCVLLRQLGMISSAVWKYTKYNNTKIIKN